MEALDEVAPFKTFTVKSHYKFGISEQTKILMEQRDRTRNNIKTAGAQQKGTLLIKYKKLRNQVNSMIRKESFAYNNQRVKFVKNEGDIWKIVNDVVNPNKQQLF